MDIIPSPEGGIFGAVGVAVGTFFAMLFKKKQSMSIEAHNRQAHGWASGIKDGVDKTNEYLDKLTIAITTLVGIAERQELLTTKIWEEMLRREAKE